MEPLPLIPFPPENPAAVGWEYFWQQLPYALPAFLTCLVGLALAAFGAWRAARAARNRELYATFAVASFGFGALGLVLGLRAVLADLALLHGLNAGLYPAVLTLSPASSHLIYLFTNRRSKGVRLLTYLSRHATLYFSMCSPC